MKFNIYLPDDDVHNQRHNGFPSLYFLSGLDDDENEGAKHSGFARHASKHKIAMIFPDTSPRDCEGIEAITQRWIGYGAGHYCNAET